MPRRIGNDLGSNRTSFSKRYQYATSAEVGFFAIRGYQYVTSAEVEHSMNSHCIFENQKTCSKGSIKKKTAT